MDDLTLYIHDLKRVQAMNFDLAFLVHSITYQDTKIVVDAKKKIARYIKYRDDRDREILTIVKVTISFHSNHHSIVAGDLKHQQ